MGTIPSYPRAEGGKPQAQNINVTTHIQTKVTMVRRSKTGQDSTGHAKTRQGRRTTQDKRTIPNDKTGQHRTTQDSTGQHKTTQHNTRTLKQHRTT